MPPFPLWVAFVVCDIDSGEEADDDDGGVDRNGCKCWCSNADAAKCNWCWRAPSRNGIELDASAPFEPANAIAAAAAETNEDAAEHETEMCPSDAAVSPPRPPPPAVLPLFPRDWAVWDSDEIELVSWCWIVLCCWPCRCSCCCWCCCDCCWLLVVCDGCDCELMTGVTEAVEDAAEEVNNGLGLSEGALVDDEVDGAATLALVNGLKAVGPIAEDQVLVNCRHTECHIEVRYGHEKLLPESSMSLISVSIGVLPTSRTKNSCSMT